MESPKEEVSLSPETQTAFAMLCHEANRELRAFLGEDPGPAWAEASEHIKQSCARGVAFYFENPESLPSASHESWLKSKEEDGWKFGPVKDEVAKTHPCMVPYELLPMEQRFKDFLFQQTLRTVTYAADLAGGLQDSPDAEQDEQP